jgi:hypothetical protein
MAWPTPMAPRPHDSDKTAGQYFPSQNQKDLIWAVQMWATPNVPNGGLAPVTEWRRGTAYHNGRKVQIPLETQVGMLWPTPAARDYKGAYAVTGLVRADGKPRLDLLPDAVQYEHLLFPWPTPTTDDPVDLEKIRHYLKTGSLRYSPTGYPHPRRLLLTETVLAEQALSGLSSPPTPAGPQDPEKDSMDGNPPEQWPTPRAYSFAESHQPGLTPPDIRVRGLYQDNPRYWASPHANCTTGAGNQGRQGGENLQTQAKGKLNPRWVETLMGLPIGWTTPSCADLAIVVSMNSGSSATGSCPQPQSGPSESSQPSSAGST